MDATEAVRQAYHAYYRRLVAQVYGLTADLAEAQDVVQEAFARDGVNFRKIDLP